jgi:hypothetical protein
MKKTHVFLVAALVLAAASGCSDTVRKVVMTTVDPYFHGPGIDHIYLTVSDMERSEVFYDWESVET